MNYEEEDNRLLRWFLTLEILFIILFTAFDLFEFLPVVSNSIKLAGVVLCFALSVCWIVTLQPELDRILLMLSFFVAIAADALLLFTDFYFLGMILFCIVQEFHSMRLFAIKKSVVRMDGRIASKYHNYKVRKSMLIVNTVQLLLAGIPWIISLFVTIPHVELLCVAVFYFFAFIGNLFRLGGFSKDVRLLDDMKPLRLYFTGMLLYFICDMVIGVLRIPDFIPSMSMLEPYADKIMLAVWPLYLSGIVLIALSGNRRQNYYS